jgi:hypothetical protein
MISPVYLILIGCVHNPNLNIISRENTELETLQRRISTGIATLGERIEQEVKYSFREGSCAYNGTWNDLGIKNRFDSKDSLEITIVCRNQKISEGYIQNLVAIESALERNKRILNLNQEMDGELARFITSDFRDCLYSPRGQICIYDERLILIEDEFFFETNKENVLDSIFINQEILSVLED